MHANGPFRLALVLPAANKPLLLSNEPAQSKPKGKPLSLGVIFLTIFIDLVGFSIIFPLFPAILDYYGESGLLASLTDSLDAFSEKTGAGARFTPVLFGGVLGSLYAILQFFFAPIWGALSDKYGRRPILLITTLGVFASYLIWGFAGSFALLVIARFIGGCMSGNISVATAAVADVTTKETRSKGMGIVGAAFGLGFIIGPAIGGYLSSFNLLESNPSWEAYGINPFSVVAFVAASVGLLNFIWVQRRFKESLSAEARGKAETRNPIARLTDKLPRPIARTNRVYFVFMFAFAGMEFTLTFLGADRFGFTPSQNAWMMVFVGLILAFVQGGLVRRLAPKWGERRVATSGLFLVAIGLAILAIAPSVGVLYWGLGFMAFGMGLCSPTLTSLVSLFAAEDEQGRAIGAFRAIGSLARAVGPILASLVFWWFGSDWLYFAGAGITLIAGFLCFRLPDPSKA